MLHYPARVPVLRMLSFSSSFATESSEREISEREISKLSNMLHCTLRARVSCIDDCALCMVDFFSFFACESSERKDYPAKSN